MGILRKLFGPEPGNYGTQQVVPGAPKPTVSKNLPKAPPKGKKSGQ